MSEYYLADQKAEERTRQRQRDRETVEGTKRAQDVKITLLGDFRAAMSGSPRRSRWDVHVG